MCGCQKILKVLENPQLVSLDRLGFTEFKIFKFGFPDVVDEEKVLSLEDYSEFAHSLGDSYCGLVTNGEGGGPNTL